MARCQEVQFRGDEDHASSHVGHFSASMIIAVAATAANYSASKGSHSFGHKMQIPAQASSAGELQTSNFSNVITTAWLLI